jgi:very-short-patch-repair endonuclease
MPARIEINLDDLRSAYDSGESVKGIADRLGVSRPVIIRRLNEIGIQPRTSSEAMYIRMANTSPEGRLRLAQAAHAAVRGKPKTFEQKCKNAASRELRGGFDSAYESAMFHWLTERGLTITPQKAIGPYNVDLAIDESRIAVEIFGGNWHSTGHHAARFRHRTDYILGQDWIPVYIWASTGWAGKLEFTEASADYVVALHKVRRAGKSCPRQEHVIRGDCRTTPIAKHHPHNGSVVLGLSAGNDRRHPNGRFA